jgi:hypothetical protein
MYTIIDTNQVATPQIAHLKADGITTVFRYLSSINPAGAKCVKGPEARALAAAGIRLGLVHEGWGDFAHDAISAAAGHRDGAFCAKYAPSIGAPADACIFFAVDTDASAAQIQQLVLPYFKAIKAEMSGFKVGVYGSGAVCKAVIDNGLADLAWLSCSMGWTGSHEYLASKPKELVLVQHLPTKRANLDCDPNDAHGDFGDFLPFTSPQPKEATMANDVTPAAAAVTPANVLGSLLSTAVTDISAIYRRITGAITGLAGAGSIGFIMQFLPANYAVWAVAIAGFLGTGTAGVIHIYNLISGLKANNNSTVVMWEHLVNEVQKAVGSPVTDFIAADNPGSPA